MTTAQILIIGDEILSGRTADTNSNFLARALFAKGIRVQRIEVVPDNLILIAQWIEKNQNLCDFTLVCGGIGGTPDDMTRQAIAKGLGVKLTRHPVAEKMLREYYKERINEQRLTMADLPEGCELITNPVTLAPGLKIKNIYVFAGIPEILHAMFKTVEKNFQGGPLFEKELNLQVGEGEISKYMSVLNRDFPALELGSYPTLKNDLGYRTQLVFKSSQEAIVKDALQRFKDLYLKEHATPAWK